MEGNIDVDMDGNMDKVLEVGNGGVHERGHEVE